MRSHSIPKKLDYQKILGKPRHTKKINQFRTFLAFHHSSGKQTREIKLKNNSQAFGDQI